jgi:hypothetical protein
LEQRTRRTFFYWTRRHHTKGFNQRSLPRHIERLLPPKKAQPGPCGRSLSTGSQGLRESCLVVLNKRLIPLIMDRTGNSASKTRKPPKAGNVPLKELWRRRLFPTSTKYIGRYLICFGLQVCSRKVLHRASTHPVRALMVVEANLASKRFKYRRFLERDMLGARRHLRMQRPTRT